VLFAAVKVTWSHWRPTFETVNFCPSKVTAMLRPAIPSQLEAEPGHKSVEAIAAVNRIRIMFRSNSAQHRHAVRDVNPAGIVKLHLHNLARPQIEKRGLVRTGIEASRSANPKVRRCFAILTHKAHGCEINGGNFCYMNLNGTAGIRGRNARCGSHIDLRKTGRSNALDQEKDGCGCKGSSYVVTTPLRRHGSGQSATPSPILGSVRADLRMRLPQTDDLS
jgi:hypothetical protein